MKFESLTQFIANKGRFEHGLEIELKFADNSVQRVIVSNSRLHGKKIVQMVTLSVGGSEVDVELGLMSPDVMYRKREPFDDWFDRYKIQNNVDDVSELDVEEVARKAFVAGGHYFSESISCEEDEE